LIGIGALSAALLVPWTAFAQAPAEGTSATVAVSTAPAATPAQSPAKGDDGTTDHDLVVKKLGVMFFGVSDMPIAEGAPAGVTEGKISTPVVGVRYWLNEKFGIDAGLGIGMTSSNRTLESGGKAKVEEAGAAKTGLMLHGGVPLVLGKAKHFKFLAVPELNIGWSTQTEAAQNVQDATKSPPDISRSGFLFDIGGRVGTEIQFGFIGIPQLALQASVGLAFRHASVSGSQEVKGSAGDAYKFPTSSSVSRTSFATSVQSDPWALFTNNISAIYYWP